MPRQRQESVRTRNARLLLQDERFCRVTDNRVLAASRLVDKLPGTARDLQILLRETPHRFSKEVQYSVLNWLDFSSIHPQNISLLLPSVAELLANLESETAFLWMKLGCLLGDGWFRAATPAMRRQITRTLLGGLRTARYVWGRKSALHGIEHALNSTSLRDGKIMLEAVREAALADRSLVVRKSAYRLLKSGRWWGNGGLSELHTCAKRLGKKLEYPKKKGGNRVVNRSRD